MTVGSETFPREKYFLNDRMRYSDSVNFWESDWFFGKFVHWSFLLSYLRIFAIAREKVVLMNYFLAQKMTEPTDMTLVSSKKRLTIWFFVQETCRVHLSKPHRNSRDVGNSAAWFPERETARATSVAVVFSILSVVRIFNVTSNSLTTNIASRTYKITASPKRRQFFKLRKFLP